MAEDSTTFGRTRRNFLMGAGAAGATLLAGCSQSQDGGDGGGDGGGGTTTSQGLSGEINIAGSSTVFPLASAVAEMFMSEHPDVNVTVQSTGSGAGFSNFFCPGKTDFNNASRPIAEEEKAICEENGVGWVELNIATDALTVVVNNEADFIDCLTVEELRQIWKPDPVQKWSDLRDSFPDEQISRYGAAETSGTFDYFTEAVMGEEGSHTQNYQATENDNQIVTGVAGDKYAIGYFGFAYYQGNKNRVKALGIDNGNADDGEGCIKPSLETAKSGTYKPLSRPLYTYPAKESLAEEHVAEFARFFVKQSANTELVANQIGYVPNTQEDMQAELDQLNEVIESVQS